MDIPKYGQLAKNRHEAANPNLWDGLRLALYPALGRSGRTLIDWSGNCNPVVHAGTWSRANQYTSINDVAGAGQISLGRRLLPVTGSARLYSLFAWLRRTNAGGEAGVCRQFVAAEGYRTALVVGANVRYQVGADYTSTASVAVGDIITVAITANPGVAEQMWINGRFDRTVGTGGQASDANFELDTSARDIDLLGLCVWNGKALTRSEIVALHADPFAVLRQRERTWQWGNVAAAPASATGHYYRYLLGRRRVHA